MFLLTYPLAAILLLQLAALVSANVDQYLYTLDQVDWDTSKAADPAAASSLTVALTSARSELECASLCETVAKNCVSVAWCPPGECRLLGNTPDSSALPAGCQVLALTSRRRVSGGWCPWNTWTGWSTECQTGVRIRKRVCQCPKPQAPAAGAACEDRPPDGGDTQTGQRFVGWCGWQSWQSWSGGCHTNQQRRRERTCGCITGPVASPSTQASETDSRFAGWCPWSSWSGWSDKYRSNCILVWRRKRRTRTRDCECNVAYTSSPSGNSRQTDETDCKIF